MEQPSGAPQRLRLTCWGDFMVVDAASGVDLRPRGRKARALLAYLALHAGRPVSRERMTALLWSDRAETQARASLRQTLHELRFLAGPASALHIGREDLLLRPEAIATDVDDLRAALAARDRIAVGNALPDPLECLFANLDGLSEGFDEWLQAERSRKDELVAEAAAFLKQRAPAPDAVAPDPTAVMPERAKQSPWQRGWSRTALGVAGVVAVAGLGAFSLWPRASADVLTVAVIPFESASNIDDNAFADGLSEEVLAQVSRKPGLRVTGRTSSWQFKNDPAGAAKIGRILGVRYLVEGSVRRAGQRLRVNVALVEGANGTRLWSETYDGTIADTFSIQQRIGTSVAAALGQQLAVGGNSRPRSVSGTAYSAYLTARGHIRERSPSGMIAAEAQLRRAVAIDPGFAPAWSSLAQVVRWHGNEPGDPGQKARAEALALARRAVALAPDLAEARGVLGMILGFGDSAGRAEIRAAARLDPNNSELLFWLGNASATEGRFDVMLWAYRRAFDLDPLWRNAQFAAASATWRMGDVAAARAIAKTVAQEASRYDAHMLLGNLAVVQGDLSQSVGHFMAAKAASADPGRRSIASINLGSLLLDLGLEREAVAEWAANVMPWRGQRAGLHLMPKRFVEHLRLKRQELPTMAAIRAADMPDEPAGRVLVSAMVKTLLRHGHAHDVVAQYDSKRGLLGFSAQRPALPDFAAAIRDAPLIVVALRARNRRAEADRLLESVAQNIDAVHKRSNGHIPADVAAAAAQTWALRGETDRALDGLERARRNGWLNADFAAGDLLDDLGDEPAFAGLRTNARFAAIRRAMAQSHLRERAEVLSLIEQQNRRRSDI